MYVVQTDQLYLKPRYFDSETAIQGKYQQQTMNRVTCDGERCLDIWHNGLILFLLPGYLIKQKDHIYMIASNHI